jgi:type IV pilus assembly protein PilA
MLQALRRRLEQDEEGFTLIELMVVVLIIAILLAIAIPTFLGARTKAQDRAAQSNLRNAFTAEKTIYVDGQNYVDNTSSAMTNVEPSLTYAATGVPAKAIVTITVANVGQTVTLAMQSASGECWYLKDIATGAGAGTTYGHDTASPCSTAGLNYGIAF